MEITGFSHSTHTEPLESRIPEILAPAGGRAQFFAALNSGADAVYLGLKDFNARARAENFTLEDLEELVPLAHRFGMKVLVTMNILIKDIELEELIHVLARLEGVGIEAIIVQDIGLANLVRAYFPHLRMHASTQMAVHNVHGVLQAMEWGFKRVVLARELTAVEMKRIRGAVPRERVEIEAFCHGSLCYSYSGLCFFSGAGDARSGNRGECAYTCREPYKIISEPGQGFLFSMRDLDTADSIKKFVDAGVDTLKIEGRKKDAQYVSSVVKLYRHKLNEFFGKDTLRKSAPPAASKILEHSKEGDLRNDLSLSFQRRGTSLFLNNRYKENVIDLDNPAHHGVLLGTVEKVDLDQKRKMWVTVTLLAPLHRFDGVAIKQASKIFHARPQDGSRLTNDGAPLLKRYRNEEISFSAKELRSKNKMRCFEASPGDTISLLVNADAGAEIMVGMEVRKLRSSTLKGKVEQLTQMPLGVKLRSEKFFTMDLSVSSTSPHEVLLRLSINGKRDALEARYPFQKAEVAAHTERKLRQELQTIGPKVNDVHQYYYSCVGLTIDNVCRAHLDGKAIKALKDAIRSYLLNEQLVDPAIRTAKAIAGVRDRARPTAVAASATFAIKCDTLNALEVVSSYIQSHTADDIYEVIWEPKRSDLIAQGIETCVSRILTLASACNVTIRVAVPMVIRLWDEALLKRVFQSLAKVGIRCFEVGNPGGRTFLKSCGLDIMACQLSTDFTLYAMNREAVSFLAADGYRQICLSIEDDRKNLTSLLSHWDVDAEPIVVLYKDTPLFIAEACSLTALHNGCPTADVCGYRTLEIENAKGERFFVAHDGCKSVVYGKQAYALSEQRYELQQMGVQKFRIDFMHRIYQPQQVIDILDLVRKQKHVPQTHAANYFRELL